MNSKSSKYLIISAVLSAIPISIVISPGYIERFLKVLLDKDFLPINTGNCDLNSSILLGQIGIVIFVLSIIGTFYEYIFDKSTRANITHRRQSNILKFFSWFGIGYVLAVVIGLYAKYEFTEAIVLNFSCFIVYGLLSITTYILLFIIAKVFILEEIIDYVKTLDKTKEININKKQFNKPFEDN